MKKISDQALNRFIYIVGMPRGGTSVMRNAINVHDEILLLPEMSHFLKHVWEYRSKIHDRLLKIIFQMPTFYNQDKTLAKLSVDEQVIFNKKIKKAFKDENLASMYRLYPEIYSMDEDLCDKNPTIIKCWGDKSNNFASVDEIPRFFPDCKLVLIVRDPRSNVLSVTKRTKYKEEFDYKIKANNYEYIRAALWWNKFNRKITRLKDKYESQVHIVRFEDFLENPVNSLNQIFKFTLGEVLDDDRLREKINNLNYGASNSEDKGKGVSREALDRWKSALSSDEIDIIESLCGGLASQFSYDIKGKSFLGSLQLFSKISGIKKKAYFIYLLALDKFAGVFNNKVYFPPKN